ncbi:TetR/AcrR family transcriptional regulator [Gilvimarinus algae]|uniref:TetR/AcrR family transcriptional regulator n=1 Tax=Gilvimarinus algae TaxID=3058037 RepID=A0ABT8TCG7_9GAMM|nr:TetR/AcrR family transcriptional regulator [Gilvimarinus sp. SDUM040014]MDO3381621.1 TetR/AcrR family transcriptional regulator [Gilvimarinus sp. SDUM040014]
MSNVSTKERILAAAEQVILAQGFAATSIEDILQKSAITKSGFFYHFANKQDLARALVMRYLNNDAAFFDSLFQRADELVEDPLQRLLLFLKLLAEAMQNLEQAHPGCLVVTFTYENYQLDSQIDDLMRSGVKSWQELIAKRLAIVCKERALPEGIAINDLADMFTASIEGGILFSRIFKSNERLVKQILLYRDYLMRLFV